MSVRLNFIQKEVKGIKPERVILFVFLILLAVLATVLWLQKSKLDSIINQSDSISDDIYHNDTSFSHDIDIIESESLPVSLVYQDVSVLLQDVDGSMSMFRADRYGMVELIVQLETDDLIERYTDGLKQLPYMMDVDAMGDSNIGVTYMLYVDVYSIDSVNVNDLDDLNEEAGDDV